MKKALFSVLTAATLLFAESYQVNTLSARQLGMAHTGAGITTLGSEAMHFNPGGLGFLDKTLDLSAGVTFIIPNVEFFRNGKEATNSTLGTPLYVYVASSFTDWLSAGVSFTTPYGNTVEYKDENNLISDLLQDISLAVYAIQPTVSVNLRGFGLPAISFGAGPTINIGSFSQSKMMLPAGSFNALGQAASMFSQASALPFYSALEADVNTLGDISKKYADSPVSATFEGDADVAVGFHLGALYEILPNKLSLGVSYRSKVDMKVSEGKIKGTEDVTALNKAVSNVKTALEPYMDMLAALGMDASMLNNPQLAALAQFPQFENDNFEATLPLPSNLNAGVSFRPMEKLLLAFDFQWIGWGAYDELVLSFEKSILGLDANGAPVRNQVSKKNYHDTFAYRLGAQYTVIDQLDLRCGIYFDESPVDDDYLTPESPSTNKIAGSIGLSYRPIPNLSIDAALLRSVSTEGRDATSAQNGGRNGRYEVVAWAPSIGLGFNF